MTTEEAINSSVNFYPEALAQPIPIMDEARQNKIGYGDVPIDQANELYNEPVVALANLGISGQSYYSQPNAATVEPVPGVDPNQYLRRSVAVTLSELNKLLQRSEIVAFFGGRVEIYIEDALRPLSLQQHLYDDVFPALIRKQSPGISDEDLVERRSQLIAKPSNDASRPSPHATGGAFDLSLRYTEGGGGHAYGDMVEMGRTDGDTSERANPDYYEMHSPRTPQEALAFRNRRAFYAIMTGAAFGIETGFRNNPTEWWHWGRGDQLSARMAGQVTAVYSLAEQTL